MTSLCRHLSVVSTGNCKPGHDCRRPTGVFTPPTRRDSTVSSRRRRRCVSGIMEHYISYKLPYRIHCLKKHDTHITPHNSCPLPPPKKKSENIFGQFSRRLKFRHFVTFSANSLSYKIRPFCQFFIHVVFRQKCRCPTLKLTQLLYVCDWPTY